MSIQFPPGGATPRTPRSTPDDSASRGTPPVPRAKISGMPSARAVPFYCPYCGEEDLEPEGAKDGEWHCRSCTRSFQLRFAGLGAVL